MELYNQSLEITRKIGDQQGIAVNLNNIAVVLIKKEKYGESLLCVLQACTILERVDLPPERQRSVGILRYIEDKIGSEEYQRRVEEIKSQLS